MKTFKIFCMALVAVLGLSACDNSDDDPLPRGDGNPVITSQDVPASALFGDSLTFTVNCKDEGGVALSTLKAYLYFDDEVVGQTTIRTKKEGDYTGKIYVPFLKNIPDGNAKLKLVLQNIHFTTSEQDIDVSVSRPKYDYINFVSGDKTYKMTPDASDPYLFSTTVESASNLVSGYFSAPAQGTSGNEVTFGEGTDGCTQGVTTPLSFVSTTIGKFKVTFNTLTYEYKPVLDPNAPPTEITIDKNNLYYLGGLIQGMKYKFTDSAIDGADWYYDPDFFTKNADGSFTFNAVTGTYTIAANYDYKCFRIWAMNGANPASLNDDGTGAVWIIGASSFNKPLFMPFAQNNVNWWTGVEYDVCMAQVKNKVYQVTMTVDKQLYHDPTTINFKFFGQAGWGTEFKGSGGDHRITSTSDVFKIGTGADGHDDGNVYVPSTVTLNPGDTWVLTLDLTKGVANGVLSAVKK